MNIHRSIFSCWSKFFLKLHGTSIRHSVIDSTVDIDTECNILNSKIGRCSYVGHKSWIINSNIGNFCSIGDNVYIGGAIHPLTWVSTSPAFLNVKNSFPRKRFANLDWNPFPEEINIGNDVWIGHGAVIQQGVIIGTGAIIGSNAVVTKDIPPYAIVVGVPARIIRFRFDDDVIDKLLKSEWWKLPDKDLRVLGGYMDNVDKFINNVSI